jgi:hypothetical protein
MSFNKESRPIVPNVTHDQAVTECKSFGGKLFEPKDLETNDKVFEAAVQALGDNQFWIGLHDKTTDGR